VTIGTTSEVVATAGQILKVAERDRKLGLIDAIRNNDPRVWDWDVAEKANIMRVDAAVEKWRKNGRQTLAMHPAIVEESRLAGSDKVPGEVLRALPYLNPMVIFSDPPVFDSWAKRMGISLHSGLYKARKEDRMRFLGFLTYGVRSVRTEELVAQRHDIIELTLLDTHDPDAQLFGVLCFFEIIDDAGQALDLECNSLSFPFSKTATLAEFVDDMTGRFSWGGGVPQRDTSEGKAWMAEIMEVIVGSLFYLCSTTLEAEKVPASVSKHLAKGIARKPLSLYRVGWTLGAALTRYRKQYPPRWQESQQGDVHHQQDPQHRRAHFKTVWTGPGRRIPKTVFISPYWTHRERLGEMGMNTVRRVPKDRRAS
jgi:hypothetical protein